MLQTKEKQIGEVTYSVNPFKGEESIRIPIVLAKYFGPVATREFMGLIAGLASTPENRPDWSGMLLSLPGFFETLDEETYWALIKRLLQGITATYPDATGHKSVAQFVGSSVSDSYTQVFQGRTMDVFKVIAFVLEVNYPDFFGQIHPVMEYLKKTIDTLNELKTDIGKNLKPSEN